MLLQMLRWVRTQWRVRLGGEGEGVSVPSALPGRELFWIALWDSSDSEESRARIQSWYMAGARRGQRRATGRQSLDARVRGHHDVNASQAQEAAVLFSHPRSAARARADQSDTRKLWYSVTYAQLSFDTRAGATCGDVIPKTRAIHRPTASFPTYRSIIVASCLNASIKPVGQREHNGIIQIPERMQRE